MSEFDNINGIYAKDVTLREGIATLRNAVTSQTIKPLTVTQNGTYTADPSEGTYGYSPITVDVQEQPWQPLEDGYSNFWFELTNDTLSPWLNFSAKTDDAVIDWGDGTGEVALDTLTPTHTYSKAGKYVVKVKGVTGIARQYVTPYQGRYTNTLRYVELNADVSNIAAWGFYLCTYLQEIYAHNSNITITNNAFYTCTSLKKTVLPSTSEVTAMATAQYQICSSLVDVIIPTSVETIGDNVFTQCASIEKVTIPASVTSIGRGAFQYCAGLSEIHVLATTPPTLGTNVFGSLPSDFIIYVPVGTLSAYQTAWSTYADHILEEGQQVTRAMLSRLAVSDSSEEDGSNER